MNKEVLNRKVTDLGLFMQFFLSILLLIFCIIWLFVKSNIIANVINVILGLIFMVLGYNNYKLYKIKAFTLIYIIIGLYFLVTAIIGIF